MDHVDKLIAKTRDEELAAVMAQMGKDERLGIFERVPNDERRAHVITLMAAPFGKVVLEPLAPGRAAAILREMAPDDQADILADLVRGYARDIVGRFNPVTYRLATGAVPVGLNLLFNAQGLRGVAGFLI